MYAWQNVDLSLECGKRTIRDISQNEIKHHDFQM